MLPGSFLQEKEPEYRLHTMWIFIFTKATDLVKLNRLPVLLIIHVIMHLCTVNHAYKLLLQPTKYCQWL